MTRPDPAVVAFVAAIDAYFDDDFDRANDAAKEGLSEVRKARSRSLTGGTTTDPEMQDRARTDGGSRRAHSGGSE